MNLMTPRVKCIGIGDHYPKSPFKVGDVLRLVSDMLAFPCYVHPTDRAAWVGQGEAERYPHLFHQMPWYEERTAEEMPEYVKLGNGKIVKATAWGIELGYVYYKPSGPNPLRANKFALLQDCTPATKDEYTEFIKNM